MATLYKFYFLYTNCILKCFSERPLGSRSLRFEGMPPRGFWRPRLPLLRHRELKAGVLREHVFRVLVQLGQAVADPEAAREDALEAAFTSNGAWEREEDVLDEWVRDLTYVSYIDCFDGAHPSVFVPKEAPASRS